MKAFYTLMLYLTRLELAHFKRHVHSSAHIQSLIADERRWERALWDLEHRLHVS